MSTDDVHVWYDAEADFLEVTFQSKAGFFRETQRDQVMAKVDSEGNVIGFSILQVSTLKGKPIDLSLAQTA